MGKYHVMDVSFPLEREIETLLCTIPNCWIIDDGCRIYFPPYKGDKINVSAMNGEIPKKATWRVLTATSHGSFDTFNEANKQLAYFSKTGRFNNSHCISAKLGKGMRKKKAPNRFTPNESSSEEDGCATQLQKDLDSSDEEESLIPTEPEVMGSLCRTKISNDQFKKGKQIKSPANIAAKRPAKVPQENKSLYKKRKANMTIDNNSGTVDFESRVGESSGQSTEIVPYVGNQATTSYLSPTANQHNNASTNGFNRNFNNGYTDESNSVPWNTQFFNSIGNTQEFEPVLASSPVSQIGNHRVWNPAIDYVAENFVNAKYPSTWTDSAAAQEASFDYSQDAQRVISPTGSDVEGVQLEELQPRKANNVPDKRKSVHRSALPVSSHYNTEINILTCVEELRNQQQSNSELRESTVESNDNEELKEREDKNKGKRLKQNPKNDSRTRHTISKVGQVNEEYSSDGTVKKKTEKCSRSNRNALAILRGQEEVLELLRSQRPSSSIIPTNSTCTNGENLGIPVRTIEEFNELNKLLKEEKNRIEFNNFVRRVGGQNTNVAVRLVWKNIMKDSVARLFNWEGRPCKDVLKTKIGLKKKRVCKLVLAALRLNPDFQDLTMVDYTIHTKNWMRHAEKRYQNDVARIERNGGLSETDLSD